MFRDKYSKWLPIIEPKCYDIGITDYWTNFWADDAVYPFVTFQKSLGHTNQKMSKWSKGCKTGSTRKLTQDIIIDSSFFNRAKVILDWTIVERTQ